MGSTFNWILILVLFIVGVVIIYTNPSSPMIISLGMLFIAVAIIDGAVQVYFPRKPKEVELKVVGTVEPKKTVKKRKKRPKKRKKRRR
jgi:hypothetical protein